MRRNSLKKNLKSRLVLATIAAALLTPIIMYINTFGWMITDDHVRWAEMGSAMSGIYAPILALLTLVVLLAQAHLQEMMNRHTFDQSYVQESRSDVHYYLDQLTNEFSRTFDDGSEVGRILVATFAYPTKAQLQTPAFVDVAKGLNKQHPRLVAIWSAFYSVLAGLRVHDYYPYKNSFLAAKQKAIVTLSYEGCAALDNFMWCTTEAHLGFRYEFATELEETK